MIRFLTLFSIFALSAPVFAQEEPVLEPAFEARLELAEKMHDIWPVRPKVEDALNIAAESFPEIERAGFKARMRKAIKYDQLEEESIEAMAKIYTAEELQAMIDFYGSKEGRAVSAKTGEYMAALRPVMSKMLDGALMEVRTGTSSSGL